MSKPRILVIRGGAIGDFILTLPAIRLLRETFSHCHLEILGYRHIASLAEQGGTVAGSTYADAVRNIEAAPLAGFFARNGNLSQEWCDYFASFNQVASWLFDPDEIFETNVKRAGVKHYLSAYAKISDESHATLQLARGLERLALFLDDPAPRIVPAESATSAADEWLRGQGVSAADLASFTAIHPGSGGQKKLWPIEHWRALVERLKSKGRRILLVGGEADEKGLSMLQGFSHLTARGLPLPVLGAMLAKCGAYYGHDTGVSHLAAAVGTPSTVLFGPTDPTVWAPQGAHVRVITAPGGDLSALLPEAVE